MTDAGKSKSWWHTLPGIIVAVTAAVTAVTGLVVAINQTGWFGPSTPPGGREELWPRTVGTARARPAPGHAPTVFAWADLRRRTPRDARL